MGDVVDFGNRARPSSDLFQTISGMEDAVRRADQFATAICALIDRGPNFGERDWQALARVARELDQATGEIAADWERAFSLARGRHAARDGASDDYKPA